MSRICTLVVTLGVVLWPGMGWGGEATQGEPEPANVPLNDTIFGKAVRLEQSVSSLVSSTTGLAISPLLGMGVLGAWQYWRVPAEQREGLPWYSHPAVWGICFSLFLLRTLKDTAGIVIPELLKKPLTVLEVMENQLSAAVVALAVLPASAAAALPGVPGGAQEACSGAATGVWAVAPVLSLSLLLLLPMLLLFTVVSTVGHAVKCLLLLSPSSLVSAGIKLARGAFLATFAITAYLMPWAGVVFSVVIVLICARLFGWAFRWNVYGTLFVWDFLGSRFDHALGAGEPLRGFLGGGAIGGLPARTYGTIRREGDGLAFQYRPWLVFPGLIRRIPLSGMAVGVRKGLFFPSITLRSEGSETWRTLVEMRLRFRGHEDPVADRIGAVERQPSRVIQGVRNAVAWMWDLVRSDFGGRGQALPGREGG